MNELKMIKELLPEPAPPSERATGAAFEALEAEIAGRGTRTTRTARRRLPGTGIGRRGRFGLSPLTGLAGLVAAGTAVAIAVAAVGDGGEAAAPGAGPVPGGTPASAKEILLAAAGSAAKEKAGRYWRVEEVDGQAYRIGEGANAYTVLGYSSQKVTWRARSASDDDVFYSRDVGARPLTPADREAWRRAGSPKTMRAWSNDRWVTLSTVPGKTTGVESGEWKEKRTTAVEKRRDADQRDRFCSTLTKDGTKVRKGECLNAGQEPGEDVDLLSDPSVVAPLLAPEGAEAGENRAASGMVMGFAFLTRRPATPEVRAAVFRHLAGLPGVRTVGSVTDSRGRTALALAADAPARDGGAVFEYQLLLQPKTYRILGARRVVKKPGGSAKDLRPGEVHSQQLIISIGWSNETPHL